MEKTKKKKIAIISGFSAMALVVIGLVTALVLALNQLSLKSNVSVYYTAVDVNATLSANYIVGTTKTAMKTSGGATTVKLTPSSTSVEEVLNPTGDITLTKDQALYFEYIFRNDSTTADIEVSLASTPTTVENMDV